MQWGSLCRAFLVEARWFRSEKLPTAKEYLENGKISSGVHVAMVHLFFLLGHGRGRPSIHLHHTSTLISSIATILRLSDDLGSAKVFNPKMCFYSQKILVYITMIPNPLYYETG